MDVEVLSVGKPVGADFPIATNQDNVRLEAFRNDLKMPILVMGLTSPSEKEISDLGAGGKKLGVYTNKDGALFLLLQTPTGNFDLPFNASLIEDFTDYSEIDVTQNVSLGIQLVLVDSVTRIVKLINLFALPPAVFTELRERVLWQRENKTAQEVTMALNNAMATLTTSAMIKESQMYKLKS